MCVCGKMSNKSGISHALSLGVYGVVYCCGSDRMFCGNLIQNDICLAREVKHVWFSKCLSLYRPKMIQTMSVNHKMIYKD